MFLVNFWQDVIKNCQNFLAPSARKTNVKISRAYGAISPSKMLKIFSALNLSNTETGTKILKFSGRRRRPGVLQFPFVTSLSTVRKEILRCRVLILFVEVVALNSKFIAMILISHSPHTTFVTELRLLVSMWTFHQQILSWRREIAKNFACGGQKTRNFHPMTIWSRELF